MKIMTVLLVLLLIGGIVLGVTSCFSGNKTTGGGWFIDDESGDKVVFGFNAQPVSGTPTITPDAVAGVIGPKTPSPTPPPSTTPSPTVGVIGAKGQFQLNDLTSNIKIHGEFDVGLVTDPTANTTVWEGDCTINGESGHQFIAVFQDNGTPGANPGDLISVETDTGLSYSGTLQAGNIVVHS